MQQSSSLVRTVDVTKKFGAVQALKKVSFEVRRNEIVGLLGDNGAGKSTLVKILAGVFPPTDGDIYFEEKRVKFSSPKEAVRLGIETVHQDLSLIGMLSITRNFFLGRELTKKLGPITMLDKRKMDRECRKVVTEVGVQVRSPNEYVSILSGGERQAISFGRAMYFDAKLLILDEPMTALSVRETRAVSDQIKRVREGGASIIFITHNVHHVYPVADRFVILDRGIKIGEFDKQDVAAEDIIETIATGKTTEGTCAPET